MNRDTIFFCESDFERFLRLLMDCRGGPNVRLLAYVLLPNHFHLIVQQSLEYAVSSYMKQVCWEYSRYLNRRRRRSGHLFEGRFKPKRVSDNSSLLRLSHYLHQNPVAAGLVPRPEAWRYSSVRTYKGELPQNGLSVEPILTLVDGPRNYARFMSDYDPSQPESISRFIRSENPGLDLRLAAHNAKSSPVRTK